MSAGFEELSAFVKDDEQKTPSNWRYKSTSESNGFDIKIQEEIFTKYNAKFPVKYDSDEFIAGAKRIAQFFYDIWKKGVFCDASVVAKTGEIRIHKIVLAAYSKTLAEKFIEFPAGEIITIDLSDFNVEIVCAVLVFVYTTQLHIDNLNLNQLYECASILGIDILMQLCIEHLGDITIETAIDYYALACKRGFQPVIDQIYDFILQHFTEITRSCYHVGLSIDLLIKLLLEDKLSVSSELDVFHAVVIWIESNRKDRLHLAPRLLRCVRFQLLSPEILELKVEIVDFIFTIRECHNILYEAFKYHAHVMTNSPRVANIPKQVSRKYVSSQQEKHAPREADTDPIAEPSRVNQRSQQDSTTLSHTVFRRYVTKEEIYQQNNEGNATESTFSPLPENVYRDDNLTFATPRARPVFSQSPGSPMFSSSRDGEVPSGFTPHQTERTLFSNDQDIIRNIGSSESSSSRGLFPESGTSPVPMRMRNIADSDRESPVTVRHNFQEYTTVERKIPKNVIPSNSETSKVFTAPSPIQHRREVKEEWVCLDDQSLPRPVSPTEARTFEIHSHTKRVESPVQKLASTGSQSDELADQDVFYPLGRRGSLTMRTQNLSDKRADPFANMTIITLGGVDPQKIDSVIPGRCVYQLDSSSNSWKPLALMPDFTHHHGIALLNRNIYVVGGAVYNPKCPESLGNASNKVHVFKPTTQQWAECQPMNEKRAYHVIAMYGGYLFVAGGEDQYKRKLDSVERYNPDTDTWTYVARMNGGGKMGVAMAVNQQKLYVVGGYGKEQEGNPVLDDVECLDLNYLRWVKKNKLALPRCHANLIEATNRLFLIGGRTKSETDNQVVSSLSSIKRYNDVNDIWEHVTNLQTPRHDAGCAALGTRIYIVGGMKSPSPYCLASVECYDVHAGMWLTAPADLPYPAAGIACCPTYL